MADQDQGDSSGRAGGGDRRVQWRKKSYLLTYPRVAGEVTGIDLVAWQRWFMSLNPNGGIVCREAHEDGGGHVHAFLRWDVAKSAGMRTFDYDGHHPSIEAARSERNCIKYVIKHGDYVAWGDLAGTQPTDFDDDRTRQFRALASGTMSLGELVRNDPRSLPRLAGIKRGLELYRDAVHDPNRLRNVKGFWIWGPSGCGKSRMAWECLRRLSVYRKAVNKWWDGYEAQRAVIVDDYRVHPELGYGDLLHILDIYDLRIQNKGGSAYAGWGVVVFTSVKHPREIFMEWDTNELNRRIETIELPYEADYGRKVIDQWTTYMEENPDKE